MLHQESAVAFFHCGAYQRALDIPSVHKDRFKRSVCPAQDRFSQKSFYRNAIHLCRDRKKLVCRFFSVDPVDHLSAVSVTGSKKLRLPVCYILKRDLRSRQRNMLHKVRNIVAFCHCSL